MKNKKRLVLFCLLQLTLFGLPTHAQQGFSAYDIATKANNYFPASVSASQLFSKPKEEIDYATGRATIRIPIYEIRTADFTLPISLYYVTSGIKMNQLNGSVAMGWQLEAEPMITRMTRGKPDESSILIQGSLIKGDSPSYRNSVGRGDTDPMQDLFYYRLLNGKNGKFFLEDSSTGEFVPKLLNPDNIQFAASKKASMSDYSLSLTDTDGTRYVFGENETAREVTFQGSTRCMTSWKTSSIYSVNGDYLRFDYRGRAVEEFPYAYYDFYTIEKEFPHNSDNTGFPDELGVPPHPGYWKGVDGKMNYYYLEGTGTDAQFLKWRAVTDLPYEQPGSRVEARPIERINFDGGSVEFYYESPSSSLALLKGIKVYIGRECIRDIKLTSSLAGTYMPNRYLLNKVEIRGTNNDLLERYSFKYNPGFNQGNRNAVDYWGYYNGEVSNTDLVPMMTLKIDPENGYAPIDFTIGGGYKGNNYTGTSALMLNEVTYPSGGKTLYNYEPHEFLLSEPDQFGNIGLLGGGPRLSSISDLPVSGKPVYRGFLYGADCNFNRIGFSRFAVTPESFCQRLDKSYIISNNFAHSEYPGKSVTYSNMLNEQVDDRVYYPCVGEEVNGVLTVHYNHFEEINLRFSPDIIDIHDKLSMEDSCTHHKRLLTRPLETIQSTPKLKYAIVRDLKPFSTIVNPYGDAIPEYLKNRYGNSYVTRSVDVAQRTSDVTETNHKYYDENDGTLLQKQERRSYLYPGVISEINSDQEQVSIKYSGMENPTGAYQVMQQKNVLSVPTETEHYVDSALRKRIRYNYSTDPNTNSGYSLSSIAETLHPNGSLRTVETYSSYLPCGKPGQATAIDGRTTAIVWSYGGKFPIAMAEGMQASDLTAAGIDLKYIATTHNIAESVYTILDGLRTRYPNARISTYRYDPTTGMIQKTTPDGVSEHYSYDPAGRLEEVKDNQLRTILNYEYHETN